MVAQLKTISLSATDAPTRRGPMRTCCPPPWASLLIARAYKARPMLPVFSMGRRLCHPRKQLNGQLACAPPEPPLTARPCALSGVDHMKVHHPDVRPLQEPRKALKKWKRASDPAAFSCAAKTFNDLPTKQLGFAMHLLRGSRQVLVAVYEKLSGLRLMPACPQPQAPRMPARACLPAVTTHKT
eukprot:CAMPEP_0202858792 /NCGR_PEP_ID=MMETSP1391-20130828/1168_1 /ASSEMBLY_ACC=CAM_ASM_000867 /TAXON_ID=1034604 /ORGANISM="Chlamydomonas leiostraca, Strain SAG 11-49" /LENGTH=183 /DNA_ID=CAMNT_0049537747 /DNA_START=749 /DNA_END=1301 /DNA_ORIENTATION=-